MSSLHYYNEIEPSAIARLRNLIAMGLIPAGDIDTRSIEDVRPSELAGYVQCHFFAGIGGWPLALALAGWPVDRSVWTGSCPCQPFSAAGKGLGFEDERHLWPAWQHLIAQRRPSIVFGEQVASKDADPWIDLVHADMEGMAYAFGCVPFPVASIRAPHIRERIYWVADADGRNASSEWEQCSRKQRQQSKDPHVVRLVDSNRFTGRQRSEVDGRRNTRGHAEVGGRLSGHVVPSDQRSSSINDAWSDADWIACTDGKWRPVEPGTFPVAYGLPKGMGKLSPRLRELAALAGLDAKSLREAKAYRRAELHGQGNAIVPQQAAAFITAYAEARGIVMESVKESQAC